MSEQKAFTSERIYWAVEQVEREAGDIDDLHLDDNTFYLKSEADKVIANRDCEIKKLKGALDQLLKAKTEQIIHEVIQNTLIYGEGFIRVPDAMKLIAEIRHHKYKRCLAMAKWCETQFAYYIASCDRYDSKYVNKKAFHFYKWKYKWLELAEEYK